MKITYIHHSSFLVELEQTYYLFDYTEGRMPDLNEEKELIVFVSHRHGDHFSQEIFKLAEQHGKTHYVLSDDIWRKWVPQELLERIEFIGAGQLVTLSEGTEVKAYRSTDEGVAFLVTGEGKTVYHAGDLNNWHWEGEDQEWNRNMKEKYSEELEKMSGRHIDCAFLPLDPRQEGWFAAGMNEFMEKVGAEVVFPMHFWGDFQVIGRLKENPCSEKYREKVMDIREDGQEFII